MEKCEVNLMCNPLSQLLMFQAGCKYLVLCVSGQYDDRGDSSTSLDVIRVPHTSPQYQSVQSEIKWHSLTACMHTQQSSISSIMEYTQCISHLMCHCLVVSSGACGVKVSRWFSLLNITHCFSGLPSRPTNLLYDLRPFLLRICKSDDGEFSEWKCA